MSDKELSRQSVIEKRMRRCDAAQQLALTERQTQRLMNRFRESGAAGLAKLVPALFGLRIEFILSDSLGTISTFALPVNRISQSLPMEPISTFLILLKFLTPELWEG